MKLALWSLGAAKVCVAGYWRRLLLVLSTHFCDVPYTILKC